MIRFSRILLVLFFVLLLVQVISLNSTAQSIRIISTKDGLPQSFVSGLEQDNQGFMWIATRNGLAHYDGTEFINFQHNIHDTASPASNVISWLNKDDDGNIWVLYESGKIDVMNPAIQQVRHVINTQLKNNPLLQFTKRGWLFQSHQTLWGIVQNTGLCRFDTTIKKTRFYTFKNGLSRDSLHGLCEDSKKQIWVLSAKDISCFNSKTQKFDHYNIPLQQRFDDTYNMDEGIVDLHERKNGEIMWGDSKRIYFFNPLTHAFHTINLQDSVFGIRWIRNNPDGTECMEMNGVIYEYTDTKGLVPFFKLPLNSPWNVRSFYIDKSGLLWIGTNAEGIRIVDVNNPFFQSFAYKKDFCRDVLSGELGLSLENTFHWTSYDQKFSSPAYHLRSFNRNNKLWIALKETVVYKDKSSNNWTILPHVPYLTDTTNIGIGIKGITLLPNGKVLAIGYSCNLVQYDQQTNNWSLFLPLYLLRQKFGAGFLPQELFADQDKIWITSANDGLVFIDINTKEIRQLKEGISITSLPTNQLLGMKPDPNNPDILWIGSYQGLIALNKKSLQCTTFSVTEGLPDNTIYSIQTDQKGYLWLSTNKGLCRFQPSTHEVRIFQTRNGLPGDEFNRFHDVILPNNELVFGGTEGWVKFDPLSFKDDNFQPEVAITGLKINYAEAVQGSANHLLKPFNLLDTLHLYYNQNTVTLAFSALQFNQPQDNLYRYKLDGYDKDWVFAHNAHEAVYTQLPPGHYAFYLNASNTTGQWSSYIKKLVIVITPPWWASALAYICYAIIIAGLIGGFIRYRIAQGIMKREIGLKENEAVQMKEMDEMKTRFFSNITHEFRTPLTLIIGPAEELKQPNVNAVKQNGLADIIIKNANQLLILVNRLLDLSKLEAKALKIYEQKGNPASIVGTIVHSFEFSAKTNEIELAFINNTGELTGWFYPDALERITYNLLSNAIKFTPMGGKVSVSLHYNEEEIMVTVKDTGIGIGEDQQPYIFERYHQGDKPAGLSEHQSQASTGLGLALVKELVDLQNGTIEVTSSVVDKQFPGTKFIVTLPFRAEVTTLFVDATDSDKTAFPEIIEEDLNSTLPVILLVEDNVEIAQFITNTLNNHYQVTYAANGKSGFEMTIAVMPDIIISDVLMPEMDGYTFCTTVKNDIRVSHIPVILLTAKSLQENIIEGLSKGADDYITKPFHPSELFLRIHNLLDRQKKLREKYKAELVLPIAEEFKTKETAEENKEVQDPFIEKLYQFIEEHLDDSLFGVDQFVDLSGISRTSLHRKLKAVAGVSTSEFIRLYRLKRATMFLKEGNNSTDTAYYSGFGSAAYFTKCFRETYGITPGEFVRKYNVGGN